MTISHTYTYNRENKCSYVHFTFEDKEWHTVSLFETFLLEQKKPAYAKPKAQISCAVTDSTKCQASSLIIQSLF